MRIVTQLLSSSHILQIGKLLFGISFDFTISKMDYALARITGDEPTLFASRCLICDQGLLTQFQIIILLFLQGMLMENGSCISHFSFHVRDYLKGESIPMENQ